MMPSLSVTLPFAALGGGCTQDSVTLLPAGLLPGILPTELGRPPELPSLTTHSTLLCCPLYTTGLRTPISEA